MGRAVKSHCDNKSKANFLLFVPGDRFFALSFRFFDFLRRVSCSLVMSLSVHYNDNDDDSDGEDEDDGDNNKE